MRRGVGSAGHAGLSIQSVRRIDGYFALSLTSGAPDRCCREILLMFVVPGETVY